MNFPADFNRELRFMLRQRSPVLLLVFLGLSSCFAVWTGVSEIEAQNRTIAQLLAADQLEREAAVASQADYGGAAYYSFFLTYDPPSDSAFATFGQRDNHSWKHRVRMLALEGQIYESDAGNPALAVSGTFDFSFLASVLLPLFIIVLLYDLFSSERSNGRFHLLAVMTGDDRRLWRMRTLVRVSMLIVVLVLPLWAAALISESSIRSILLISLVVAAHAVLWAALAFVLARRTSTGPVTATQLLAVWVMVALVIPFFGGALITRSIPGPENGEIVLSQREVVNAAWDLPKSQTMEAFSQSHPQWRDRSEVTAPFEWKWYYAFQQVGDESVLTLSNERREAIATRYSAGTYLSLLSPPMLAQRLLNRITRTGPMAALNYEESIRDFHGSLRQFYYPLLFNDPPFDEALLQAVPLYEPPP